MAAALLMIAGGTAAGAFGAMLGLGGGILIVPLLTIGFGLPIREAIGASLVAVVATSGAAAGAFLERGLADLRLGMSLELFTVVGALIGGLVAFAISEQLLAGLFAILLVYVAVSMLRRAREPEPAPDPRPLEALDPAAAPDVSYVSAAPTAPDASAARDDRPAGRAPGFGLGAAGGVVAGAISALLGVGGGIVTVPLMHLGLGVPLRVSAATSNLMMGVTACASAFVYLARGQIDPFVAGPIVLGVFIGASVSSRLVHRVDLRVLRLLFVAVLAYTALQMTLRALGAG